MNKDVDLGNGCFISWTTFEGERCGGILIHPKTTEPNNNGECWGSFWFRNNNYNSKYNRKSPEWDFNNDFEIPTLSPSFLCHCGFHGFIENGKWRNA